MRCLLIAFIVYSFSISTNAITSFKHALACESTKLILQCPENKVIHILDGNYGRTTSLICTNGPIKHDNCLQEKTVDILTTLCEGKQDCVVVAENNIFGDSCVGTHKYLYALYQCKRSGEYKHSLGCEDKPVHLDCDPEKVIQIQGANYGRRSQNICYDGPTEQVNCVAETTSNIVKGLCNGKKSCTFLAKNAIFGDPCPGTYKYLSVKYKCIMRDEEDESDNTDLHCLEGTFILPSLLCDGKRDCIHGEDELVCSFETNHVCEHGTLSINCPHHKVIKITNANYGRTSAKICRQQGVNVDISCKADRSLQLLKQNCAGKQSCEVQASNNVFGDPCPRIEKYLEVQYFCEEETDSHNIIPRSINF